MAACVFCEIVAGKLPAARVYEDAHVVAFLDRRPVFLGHVLVVPRAHHEVLGDLPPAELQPVFAAVQLLARAVEQGREAGGTFVAMNNRISQSVPHLHVHVVPRAKGDGLRGFFWPRRSYGSEAEMEAVRAAIEQAARPRGG